MAIKRKANAPRKKAQPEYVWNVIFSPLFRDTKEGLIFRITAADSDDAIVKGLAAAASNVVRKENVEGQILTVSLPVIESVELALLPENIEPLSKYYLEDMAVREAKKN